MYRIDLPMDAKEAAVISRRRRVEEERKLRIFNPHERIVGVIHFYKALFKETLSYIFCFIHYRKISKL